MAQAARAAGWAADELPLADGGEGTLEALVHAAGPAAAGGSRQSRVSSPLGAPVGARWWFLTDTSSLPMPAPLVPGGDPTAVIEGAAAAGRALVPHPRGDDPVRASTAGVGQLILAAVAAGARQVVVAIGGSATTDGGAGAVDAVGGPEALAGVRVVVACDVTTRFLQAATVFGPQKGASPEQVRLLSERLAALAERYRVRYGVDIETLVGAGAAGGLAGGLAALGASLVSGYALVAAAADLEGRLGGADLVVTGEGRVDATSFQGKVVGGVLSAAHGAVPALCVVGQAEPEVERWWAHRRAPVRLVTLVEAVGSRRALEDTAAAAAACVTDHLERMAVGEPKPEGAAGPAC
jgi:glycerate 2-kinase